MTFTATALCRGPTAKRLFDTVHCHPRASLNGSALAQANRNARFLGSQLEHQIGPRCKVTRVTDGNPRMRTDRTHVEDSQIIDGTPCFTKHIAASPMSQEDRSVYISAATEAVLDFVNDLRSGPRSAKSARPYSNVCIVNVIVPQLNPELDVYDRRFLLSLTWSLVKGLINVSKLSSRVLVQGAGKYGAVPLSVSGLRRQFEADMMASVDLWGGVDIMRSQLRVADLEDPAGIDETDEAIVVVSPTNAAGMPVIDDMIHMVERAGPSRPIICINPRLADVPSASGVMQVAGRSGRNRFLDCLDHAFCLRLLYDAGTMYPLRGILFRRHGHPWQVYHPDELTENYRLVAEFEVRPDVNAVSDALAADRRRHRRRLSEPAGLDIVITQNLTTSVVMLLSIALAALVYRVREFGLI
jgi:hypothetical protein